MITVKQYKEAKAIVEKYEAQQAKIKKENRNSVKLKIGDKVTTKKGCRMSRTKLTGKVVGFGSWGEYPAVKVKKDDNNRIVMCLKKNLIKT